MSRKQTLKRLAQKLVVTEDQLAEAMHTIWQLMPDSDVYRALQRAYVDTVWARQWSERHGGYYDGEDDEHQR